MLLGLLGADAQDAAIQELPASSPLRGLGGRSETILVAEGETLVEIAHRWRLGFDAIARLNPGVDPWIPMPGTIVELPTRLIWPPAEPEGLVINVPEMRLYDFTVNPVEIFAIAIGDEGDPSLIGDYQIGEKRIDPAWRVPQSILREKPDLPPVVPAGPANPLGSRWMTIGATSYGIHGTNLRWSIGREATHGCIRLYEDEIQRLYDRIPTGTRIQLIYAPYKWGAADGRLYLEVHPDVYDRIPDRMGEAMLTPRALELLPHLDLEAVAVALEEARGIPIAVGTLPASLLRPQPSAPTSTPMF